MKRLNIGSAMLLIFFMPILCYGEFNEDQQFGFFVDRMFLTTEIIVFNEKLNQLTKRTMLANIQIIKRIILRSFIK